MNKNVFSTNVKRKVSTANAVNRAGGVAYSRDAEDKLCQLTMTGTFNGTYYASHVDNYDDMFVAVNNSSSDFIAKLAVFAATEGGMKDTPCFLLAMLCARGELELVKAIFDRVIYSPKMLCIFVQIVRSGVTGRKSFGSSIKKLIQNWIASKAESYLFSGFVGHSSPSISDIIRMVHPKAETDSKNNMFRYLIGLDFNESLLPENVRKFEEFKRSPVGNPPNVDFTLLSNIKMTQSQWESVALHMNWTTLRMNLNTLSRNGVFNNSNIVDRLADKLGDASLVENAKVFPYQLLTTYNNIQDVPTQIKIGIMQAMEHATRNVPSFDSSVSLCLDISSSMNSPVTGFGSKPTKTTCRDVASLMACVCLRKNMNTEVIAFHTSAIKVKLNPLDTVMTNSAILNRLPGGGTDCACAISKLNDQGSNSKLVIMISDNESWVAYNNTKGTGLAAEWSRYKSRVKDAKLVLIDLQPGTTTQIANDKDVLNIGGFSDDIWEYIRQFALGKKVDFSSIVRNVKI